MDLKHASLASLAMMGSGGFPAFLALDTSIRKVVQFGVEMRSLLFVFSVIAQGVRLIVIDSSKSGKLILYFFLAVHSGQTNTNHIIFSENDQYIIILYQYIVSA